MGGGAVGGAGAARGDAVAVAVATVAEEGAAFEDFAGAKGFVLSAVLGGGQAVGVCSPLPDVADDVVEAVAVGSKRTRGRGGEPAVAPAVVAGEVTLPDVAVGAQFVEIQAAAMSAGAITLAPGMAPPCPDLRRPGGGCARGWRCLE